MIKIDWNEYFFHRVIFGMHVMRRVRKKRGVETERNYYYRWQWQFNRINNLSVPWHRCWIYEQYRDNYLRD